MFCIMPCFAYVQVKKIYTQLHRRNYRYCVYFMHMIGYSSNDEIAFVWDLNKIFAKSLTLEDGYYPSGHPPCLVILWYPHVESMNPKLPIQFMKYILI